MERLCIDQFIGKLITIFNNDSNGSAKAESWLTAEAQARQNDHEKLFNAWIATLKDRGVPEQVVAMLKSLGSGGVPNFCPCGG